MTTLILEPTITAQWQALVKAAENSSHLILNEELESYLVFLLTRFNTHPEIVKSVLGLEFLNSYYLAGRAQQEQLRDVGDKCLLFAGLFPGRAERRRVKVSYFVELGQGAYNLLASLSKQKMAELYMTLGKRFVVLMDVLQAMRAVDGDSLTPLQAFELWHDSGSQQALAVLRRYSQGWSVVGDKQAGKMH